jgi:Tol biopolymer transport system component
MKINNHLISVVFLLSSSCNTGVEPEINYHNKILFTSSRSGQQQLYMMNPNGTEIRQITTGPYWHYFGRWSPDAQKIVALTTQNITTACVQMVVMNAVGTNRRLIGCGVQMAWSPDGKKIAFSFCPSCELGDRSKYIYVVNAADGKWAQLTNIPNVFDTTPCWSLDGNYIYFSSNRHDPSNNNPEIYRMNTDGSNIVRVTFTPSGYSTSPSISPDGDQIVFVSNREGITPPAIFIMKTDTSALTKIAEPPVGEVFNYPRWSSDGMKLTFVSGLTDGSARTYVYVVNIDGTNLRRLIPEDSTATLPDWSW